MPAQPPTSTARLARAQQRATRVVFLICGCGMAGWAPLVPFAKARAGLDDAQLGLLLLCLGVGSLITMPLSGALVARLGCRRVILASTGLLALPLPLLATLDRPLALAACLFVFGAGLGGLDVGMNIQAVAVERDSGRPMMSGFHARFSLGAMFGSGGLALLLGAGAGPLAAALAVVAVVAVLLVIATPALLSDRAPRGGPAFAIPRGIVLGLGAVAAVAFLAEGAVFDWSAVFLASARGLATARAGLGYAAFSVTMTIGRLTGDRIVARFGRPRVVLVSALAATAGFAIVILLPAWPAAVLGYAVVGCGCANIAPVLFTAAGRQTAMPEAVAIPAMMTLAYAGLLAGPAVIGAIARATSLPTAFLLVAGLLLGSASATPRLRL